MANSGAGRQRRPFRRSGGAQLRRLPSNRVRRDPTLQAWWNNIGDLEGDISDGWGAVTSFTNTVRGVQAGVNRAVPAFQQGYVTGTTGISTTEIVLGGVALLTVVALVARR